MSQGDGSDHQVVGADERALDSEVGADSAIFFRTRIVEGNGQELLPQLPDQPKVVGLPRGRTVEGPIVKFTQDDGTKANIIRVGLPYLLNQRRIFLPQVSDPGVGIEKIDHYKGSRSSF